MPNVVKLPHKLDRKTMTSQAAALVAIRLVGVIEAEQTEQGNTARNDRLLAVTTCSH